MPIIPVSLPVSFGGEAPAMRTVQKRTPQLSAGVLCEVWADERFQLCLVDRINADGSIVVRRLPEFESAAPRR